MILSEPSATPADLHFRLLGFPVRVHPFFWLICLLLARPEPRAAAIWVAAVFVSVLVHELGHALLQRHYGGRSRIVLYGMGGLAISEGVRDTPWRQVLISLAGPFAGFTFAALLAVALIAAGVPIAMRFVPFPVVLFAPLSNAALNELLTSLLWINIMWGVLNLAPIYPLDGGRVSRELLTMYLPAHRGVIASLWLSIGCAVALALYYLSSRGGSDVFSLFPVLMFGLLAYSNYQMLQAYQTSRGRGW